MKEHEHIHDENEEEIKSDISRLVIGILLIILAVIAPVTVIYENILIILAYIILLSKTAKTAIKELFLNKEIDEKLLITISCIGAYLIGERFEGLMVIILYEIGEILEDKSLDKSRKSIKELMNIKPEYANLKNEKEIKQVKPEEVKIGNIILVKEGEKIPLDGIVKKGKAQLNTSSLTGESNLLQIKEGEKVLSGSIVIGGVLEIEVISEYKESTVNKILELVEKATDKKAKTEKFVNKAASIYTPIVIVFAILVAVFLPLFTNITFTGSNGSIYRALIFLVISCPCSIAISVPLSYFSGIGKASKEGILIKGSEYIDTIKDIKQIVFDKTGTLTNGNFEVQKVYAFENYTKNEILKYVAIGEKYSNHPIAKSILKANKENIEGEEPEEFNEIKGKGISYKYNNKNILIGNELLVGEDMPKTDGDTGVYVKINDKIVGIIYLGDTVKKGAKEAIRQLHYMGVRTNMFTGDNKKQAEKVGEELEIKNIKSEMLPQDKFDSLEEIINKTQSGKVAFVGDGINDAPVLARSMGGIGSDSAIEASDVVIMTDNILKVSEAIKISKKTCKIIKQNLIFAIVVKLIILLLSVVGIGGMWQAVFADVGVTLITIFNSLRILR